VRNGQDPGALGGRRESQAWNDDEMLEFEASGNDVFAESSQVVLVGTANLLNQAVKAKAFESTGHLSGGFLGDVAAEGFVLKATDVVFASGDSFKQQLIVGIEEIEAGE